ncbi:MAG: ABC transporter permease [Oscillospiraceae bacterium]|nr:ABC transporter permease [Oscillospiraceae bacterium]
MFIRNGIKSNLRERGRTALFSLLIVFLTVAMILSLSVLLYCNSVMRACDAAYRSIALIEYMGVDYPDEDEPDPAARAAAAELTDEAVLSVPGVTAWTRGNVSAAAAEGYDRYYGASPYAGRSVVVVSRVSSPVYQYADVDENGEYVLTERSSVYNICFLKSAIYSRNAREETLIDLLAGDVGFEPEQGKSYVLNGEFLDVSGSAMRVGAYPMNGLKIFRVESFLDSDEAPFAEYTDADSIPEVFLEAADAYRAMNNYVRVIPCRDVSDVYLFHQNELQLTSGAMPDPGTPGACVVSSDLASDLGLAPGDEFTMEDLNTSENDRYDLSRTGVTRTYTLSGVVSESYDRSGCVWVIADNADAPLFGYLLGTVSLRNESAEEAVEALEALVPQQVRVTLYDQGYGSAVQPFREVKKTAVNVLIVCSAGVAAVLLLFAFLFVGRQSDTVKIMVSLGTPARKTALWFLSGALLICGASAVIGAAIGAALRPVVLRKIAEAVAAARAGDGFIWYSETSLGVVKQTSFDPQVPLWPAIPAAVGIVLLALAFCLLFLRLARRSGTRRRGRSRVRVPHGETSSRGRGGLRFALISIRRGGLRSLVVPLVSLVLTVTVLFLGGVYQKWQNELDDALETSRIDGMVVSLNGRYYSGLSLSVSAVRSLLEVEGVEDVAVSFGYHYWLPEDEPDFNPGATGRERRRDWISIQPEMVALNSLTAAKEFYYSDPDITWLDGWDESMLADTRYTPLLLRSTYNAEPKCIPAVLSTAFMEEHGLALGDVFSCMVLYESIDNYPMEIPVNLYAVGSYVQREGRANIYVPLICHAPAELLTGGEAPASIGEKQFERLSAMLTFRTCRFRLSSARELDAVRERLREQGFSAVGRMSAIRTTVLLRDAAFLKFTESMERNIAMGKVLSTAISLMIVLLGFIISWLMTFSRRREFALMRGFGARKGRVFASFFLEQAILSLAGCLVGCLVLFWLYAGGATQPLAAAAYLVCYLLGTAVSILTVGKTDLMELLTVRD